MKNKILVGIVSCCIFVFFTGCNLMKSPISMVKKFGIWQLSDEDRWRDNNYSNPTWERIVKEYKYFAGYKSSNWSKQKLGGKWYLHYIDYSTRFNDSVTDKSLASFVIKNDKNISINEILDFFMNGIKISENKTYNGISVIYASQYKTRILEVIAALKSGNVTDISFSNGIAVLRWITNKLGDSDYGEDIVFLGTYIVADVKLEYSDGTESSYERLVFYTIPDDPLDPYRYDRPFSFY